MTARQDWNTTTRAVRLRSNGRSLRLTSSTFPPMPDCPLS